MDRTELREKINAILLAGDIMLNPPQDLAEFISKPAVKLGRTDQLLALFDQEAEAIREEERERIFREIDKNSATEKLPYRDGGEVIRTIPESTYQALKDKE